MVTLNNYIELVNVLRNTNLFPQKSTDSQNLGQFPGCGIIKMFFFTICFAKFGQ